MKFELNDDYWLKCSSAMIAAHAVPAILAGADMHKKYRVPGTPRDETMENWWIHGLSINAAQGVVAASSDNAQLKKDMLKVHGAGWVAAAALDAYHAYGIKTQNQAVSTAGIVSQGALAAVCLWRGFN